MTQTSTQTWSGSLQGWRHEIFPVLLVRGALMGALLFMLGRSAREVSPVFASLLSPNLPLSPADPTPFSVLVVAIALAFALRAVIHIALGVRDLLRFVRAARMELVTTDDALTLRSRGETLWQIPPGHMVQVEVVERSRWRRGCVYVHVWDGARLWQATIPGALSARLGTLYEALVRWQQRALQGSKADRAPSVRAAPLQSASTVDIPTQPMQQAGHDGPGLPPLPTGGVTVTMRRRQWLDECPWAVGLLVIALLLHATLSAGAARLLYLGGSAIGIIALGVVLWMRARRVLRPFRTSVLRIEGKGLVLRDLKRRLHEVPWSKVLEVTVTTRLSWSIVLGVRERSTLTVDSSQLPPFHFPGDHLAPPAASVRALIEACRKASDTSNDAQVA